MDKQSRCLKVAVIIVNYNGYLLTRDCLLSFKKVDYDKYIIIVVDNGSSDGSVPRLLKEFPDVCYVQSTKNTGFTGGNNLGLKKAYELGAKYIFFLNNDTTVSHNIFDLVGFLDEHPDVGMVAPLTFYYDRPEIISFGGGHLNRNTGRITFLNKGKRHENITDNAINCTFLEGTAIMAREELVRHVGGFNEDYFLTSEESELCVRIIDKGYRLALTPACYVMHKVSQTMGTGSELISYFVYRNRLLFIRNNAKKMSIRDSTDILLNYLSSFSSLVLKYRNWPAARGLIFGVSDYVRGIRGAGRYSELLKAR
jgi:hypothetical protein